MASLDFLYYSLGFGFLILVGFLAYAAFCLSQTLRELTSILIKIDDVTTEIDELKNKIKYGIMTLLNIFFKKIGGDKG